MSRAPITATLGSGMLGATRILPAHAGHAVSADMAPETAAASVPSSKLTFADHLGRIRDVSKAMKATKASAAPSPPDDTTDTIPDLRRLLAMGTLGQLPLGKTTGLPQALLRAGKTSTSVGKPPAMQLDPSQLGAPAATATAPAAPAMPTATTDPAIAAVTTTPTAAGPQAASAAPATEPPDAPDAPPQAAQADAQTDVDTPRTPLEQAVHDLIDQLRASDHPRTARDTEADRPREHVSTLPLPVGAPTAAAAPPTPGARAPIAALPTAAAAALPDDHAQLASPSHMHLVVGEGEQRVVMTVAVRGADINVTMRASDDSTAAALARNAGSLDDALRARGLTLADLGTEREPETHRDPHSREPSHSRTRTQPDAEPFALEETPA